MGGKKINRVGAAFAVLVLLVIGVLLSNSLRRSSHIVLPPAEAAGSGAEAGGSGAGEEAVTAVTVTPETVQTAIATLERPASYRRTVELERFWSGGSGTSTIQTAVSGGLTRTDTTGEETRHAITGGGTTYLWYGGERTAAEMTAGDFSADDEQEIPTYEEILDLPAESIAAADYRTLDGINCIYVETAPDPSGRVLRCWVSVDTGLLTACEKLENGAIVYRMRASLLADALPTAADFTLPDGTALLEE